MSLRYRQNSLTGGHRVITLLVLCLFGLCLSQPVWGQKKQRKPAKQEDRIFLDHADDLSYDDHVMPGVQRLKGNVRFRYQDTRLSCDSAYFNQRAKTFQAFGHVKVNRTGGITLSCARLTYNGFSQLIQARKQVVLTQPGRSLHCDSLDYNQATGQANYFGGRGRLVAGATTVLADVGDYNTNTKDANFSGNVIMQNPKYRITTPTLHYNTKTGVAHVQGKSVIHSAKGEVVHTNDGVYDTRTDHMQLRGPSTVTSPERDISGDNLTYNSTTGDGDGYGHVKLFDKKQDRTVTGEEVHYNSKTGESEGRGNVKVHDRKNQRDISGEYLRYNSQTKVGRGRGKVVYVDHKNHNAFVGDTLDYTESSAIAYGHAIAKEFSEGDTLFVHADTVRMRAWNLNTDSVYRKVYGINNVRAYRTDLQAVCGLLIANSQDSCITLYHDPIAWSDNRQLLGDSIKVFMNDSTVREVQVLSQALSIEQMDDGIHYNQVSAKQMYGYFEEGKIRWGQAIGNVLIVFYPVDDKDSSLVGLNYTETDTMRVYFSPERKLQKVWMPKTVGTLYPMTQIPANKEKLPTFAWFDYIRPLNKYDLFRHIDKGDKKLQHLMIRVAPPTQIVTENLHQRRNSP